MCTSDSAIRRWHACKRDRGYNLDNVPSNTFFIVPSFCSYSVWVKSTKEATSARIIMDLQNNGNIRLNFINQESNIRSDVAVVLVQYDIEISVDSEKVERLR